jgi:hypothetical protein
VNTVAPVLSGTNITGQTLSVTTGTWTGEPAPTFGYQWRTCTTSDCVGGTINDISGATSATFQLTNAQIGFYVQAVVTGTNVKDTASAASNVSTTTISGIAPVNTVAPVLSGTATTGETLSVTNGTWTGEPAPTFGYQWRTCTTADCDGGTVTNIAGATSATYQLTNDQIGLYVQAVVTGTNVKDTASAASNVSSAAISGIAPVNTVAPVLSGTNVTGQTLSVTNGTWTGEPAPTFGYQWRTCTTADCVGGTIADIVGATSATFQLTNAQIGFYVQAVVTGTNVKDTASAASNVSAAISGIAPVNTVAPVLSGTNITGQTLSVTNGTWTGEPAPTFG